MSLPAMTVEQRQGRSHGLAVPDTSDANMMKELGKAIVLNGDAKHGGWKDSTIDILVEYIGRDVTKEEIVQGVQDVFGFYNWSEVTQYVQKDMCSDFFNRCLSYCIDSDQANVNNLGFIDGSGIGYLEVYRDRLKVTLEQAFDEKYLHKVKRPLEYALDRGMDIISTANFIHPGHFATPAGHGVKFLTVIEVLRSVFDMSQECDRKLFIVACVFSMGRSGSLIHYPMDNLAGGKLTNLIEFT